MFRLLFVTFFGTYRGNVDPSDLGLRHPELAGTPRIERRRTRVAPSRPGMVHERAGRDPDGPDRRSSVGSISAATQPVGQFFAAMFDPVHGDRRLRAAPRHLTRCSCWPDSASRTCATQPRARCRCGAAFARRNGADAGVLTNAFYFDAALDCCSSNRAAAGHVLRRVVDPHVIDGAVREAAISAAGSACCRSLPDRARARVRVDPGLRRRLLLVYYASRGSRADDRSR